MRGIWKTLGVALCLGQSLALAQIAQSEVLVPKASRGGLYIELMYNQPVQTPEGKHKLAQLRRLLASTFRPMTATDAGPYWAKCTAGLREWSEGDLTNTVLKVECWSEPPPSVKDGRVLYLYDAVDTPEGFLKLVNEWTAKHQARLRSLPQPPAS